MCTYHTLYTHENQESSTSSCGLNRFAIWHEIWLPLVSILHASQPRQVRKGQRSGFFLRKLSQKVSSAQLISTFILAHASTCRLVEILPVILPQWPKLFAHTLCNGKLHSFSMTLLQPRVLRSRVCCGHGVQAPTKWLDCVLPFHLPLRA